MKTNILTFTSVVLLLAMTSCQNEHEGFHIVQCNKNFAPYCGKRIETFAVRKCHTSCECMYSDEYCDNQGICVVDQRLYEHFKCPEDYPVQHKPMGGCVKDMRPDCRVRTMEIRDCGNSCDCKYTDEFCNYNYQCQVDISLYENYRCPRQVAKGEEPLIQGGLNIDENSNKHHFSGESKVHNFSGGVKQKNSQQNPQSNQQNLGQDVNQVHHGGYQGGIRMLNEIGNSSSNSDPHKQEIIRHQPNQIIPGSQINQFGPIGPEIFSGSQFQGFQPPPPPPPQPPQVNPGGPVFGLFPIPPQFENCCFKNLMPYCGFRPSIIVSCQTSCDCSISDEYCSDQGWCTLDQSLYEYFRCPNYDIPNPIDLCDFIECPFPLTCFEGRCVRNKCELVKCRSNEFCRNGYCCPVVSEDRCSRIRCPPGEFCFNSRCQRVCTELCIRGYHCVDGRCVPIRRNFP